MNIILSVYSKEAFREYQLPSVNNADYAITLRSDFFHLRKNWNLYMEVLDYQWRFKRNAYYGIKKNGSGYEGQELKNQDILNLDISGEHEIVMIVKYVDSVFHAYEKFSLADIDRITIGEKADHDISYSYMKLVSRSHAVIEREGGGFKIINHGLNGTYVDARRIEKEQKLVPGACIDIMGLRMIYLGSCLAVDVKRSGAKVNTEKLKHMLPVSAAGSAGVRENAVLSHGKTIYHRSPRTFCELAEGTVEIEMPPQKEREKAQPLLLTIGPSLTMALPMMAGCMLMISPSSGGSSLSMYSGLVMTTASALLGVFWALQNIRYEKKHKGENAKLRFERYSEYLVEKTEEIKAIYENTSKSLFEMYPAAGDCLSYDESKGVLWNRNVTHEDYLKQRLGIGNVPFQIVIQTPRKHFSLLKDELEDKPFLIRENYDMLYDVPIALDLGGHKLVGVVGGPGKTGAIDVARLLTAQIAANNCYTDVKLGFIYNQESFRDVICCEL